MKQALDQDIWAAAYDVTSTTPPVDVVLEEDPRVVNGSLHSMQTAWRQPFSGDIHNSFLEIVDDMNDNFKDNETVKHYAKLLPVIQSSGVGKSRLLDEVCRHRLGITFTLRLPHETGYPPGDIEITEFLGSSERKNQSEHSTMVAFLSSAVAEGMFATLGFRNLMLLFLADILPRSPVTALADDHIKTWGSATGFETYFHKIMSPLEYQKSPGPPHGEHNRVAPGVAIASTRSPERSSFCTKVLEASKTLAETFVKDESWMNI
jgi:hypothetical protein